MALGIPLLWHWGNYLLNGSRNGSETSSINDWFSVFVSDADFKDSTVIGSAFMSSNSKWLIPIWLFEVISFSSKTLIFCLFNILTSLLIDSENLLSIEIWKLS